MEFFFIGYINLESHTYHIQEGPLNFSDDLFENYLLLLLYISAKELYCAFLLNDRNARNKHLKLKIVNYSMPSLKILKTTI